MRKFFSVLLVLLFTLGFIMNDAQAKRFGGGRSFGASRPISSFSRPQSLSTPQRNAMSNPWLNRLTGFALGGLLAYLLMGNGIASGILSWLLIAAVAFFVINLIRSKMQMAAQSNTQHAASSNPFFNAPSRFMQKDDHAGAHNRMNYPAGFDANKFLQNVKEQFVQLQAAYDQKNVEQLRSLTTPEVFMEIQHQLQERGGAENVTEVVTLDAVLLDIEAEVVTMASVRFSGLIKEGLHHAATSFNEIWHFQQDNQHSRWLVAGIQQN